MIEIWDPLSRRAVADTFAPPLVAARETLVKNWSAGCRAHTWVRIRGIATAARLLASAL
jgi:hypothetical protein